MTRPSPSTLERGSRYSYPERAEPDARIYGTFADQQILGTPCTIIAEPLADADPLVFDKLGQAGCFRLGGLAIHISGRDDFGRVTGPGYIRALASYRVDFGGRKEHCSGLGCDGPEPATIVTWDGVHANETWRHHCFYEGCRWFVTLEGLHRWWRERKTPFTARDVCAWLTERAKAEGKMFGNYLEPQHIGAIKRLCQKALYIPICGVPALRRKGRHGYEWA